MKHPKLRVLHLFYGEENGSRTYILAICKNWVRICSHSEHIWRNADYKASIHSSVERSVPSLFRIAIPHSLRQVKPKLNFTFDLGFSFLSASKRSDADLYQEAHAMVPKILFNIFCLIMNQRYSIIYTIVIWKKGGNYGSKQRKEIYN